MRKLFISFILSILSLTGMAQTIGEAFYIYRNDGQFNTFFRDEVLSIEYSNYDADSVFYNEVVTQLVYTADSVYKIPLAVIDSVAFVTPKTKYKPGVIRLEGDILNYIISQDSLSIFFKLETPKNVLPHVGDKLITMEMTELFPIGFAGEVVEVNSKSNVMEVICISVDLLDIFEQYYGATEVEWNDTKLTKRDFHGSTRKSDNVSKTFQPGTLKLSLIDNFFSHSYLPNDNLAFTLDDLYADISVTPVVKGHGFWIVDSRNGIYLKLSIYGHYNLEENFGIKGSVNWEQKKEIVRLPWPILPLADVYLEIGGFVKANAELGLKQKWTQQYESVFVWEYSSKGENVLKPVNKMISVSSSHNGEAVVKGSVGAGMYLEFGLDFIHTKKMDIANVSFEGRAGVNLEGSFVLDKSDLEKGKTSTAVYEQLQDTYLSLNWFKGLSANAKILKYGVSYDFDLGSLPFKTYGEIDRFALAPTFSDVKGFYSTLQSSTIDANAKISCPADFGGRCIAVDAGLVLIDKEGNDASIRSYEIVDYIGGMTAKAFTSQFNNVVKRNNYKVYPHIKWMGFDILASPYAEVKGESSCPDENHPHVIDLGLPSGTKWACCNVGANAPEQYGNYYAWGETRPKNYYGSDTYQYAVVTDEYTGGYNMKTGNYYIYTNIGADIAGTQYDAATTNWGTSWRMPTITQYIELHNNCSSVRTTQNGVIGMKYTGPNGGTIFFPDTGRRLDGELEKAGTFGCYWSSTYYETLWYGAYGVDFLEGGASWGFYDRCLGYAVRPVR